MNGYSQRQSETKGSEIMFKNTFGCKFCNREFSQKYNRDYHTALCNQNPSIKKLSKKEADEIQKCQKIGLENFKKAFG